MQQHLLRSIMIVVFVFKSVLVYAQDTLVFSAVEKTQTVIIAGEILRTAYQKIGIAVEICELPGERGIKYSHAGVTDGEVFRTQEIEGNYPNLKRIDVAVRRDEMYLYVRRGNEFPVRVWESISREVTVGYQSGVKFIKHNAEKYGLKTFPVMSSATLLRMLNAGRVDAVITGSEIASKLIREYGLQNIIRLEPPIYISVLYHYLHKKHAHLVPKITAVLKEMKKSGEFQSIENTVDLGP